MADMLRKMLFSCSLAFPLLLSAASPLFHAVIGERWLDHFETYSEAERQAFMLGTLYPDIRYLAGIPRSATHEAGLTIESVLATSDPFLKGMRVHMLVDVIRDSYVRRNQVTDLVNGFRGDAHLFLKMLEDEMLFNRVDQGFWHTISAYFDAIDEREIRRGVPIEIVQKWHEENRAYFSHKPSEHFASFIEGNLPHATISSEFLSQFLDSFSLYTDNQALNDYLDAILNVFLEEFSQVISIDKIISYP